MNTVPWGEVNNGGMLARRGEMDGKMARGEESETNSASWMGYWKGGGKNNHFGREGSRE